MGIMDASVEMQISPVNSVHSITRELKHVWIELCLKGNLGKINLVTLWLKRVSHIIKCVTLYLVTMSTRCSRNELTY